MEEQKEELAAKREIPAEVATRPSKKITEAEKACEGNACEVSEIKTYDRAEEVVASTKGKSEVPASPAAIQAADKDKAADSFEAKSPTLRASMQKSVSSAGLIQTNNVIIIKTSEVHNAVAQVEKILTEYSAAKVSRQAMEDKVVFRAEISKEKLKDFIEKLKPIGVIEDKFSADVTAAQQVPIVIEIRQK